MNLNFVGMSVLSDIFKCVNLFVLSVFNCFVSVISFVVTFVSRIFGVSFIRRITFFKFFFSVGLFLVSCILFILVVVNILIIFLILFVVSNLFFVVKFTSFSGM